MKKVKYLILGAGPAGLTLANSLKSRQETDFLVLEAENEAGGLCRSANVDGAPLDVGGGHFLDVRRPNVCSFIFDFMPKAEWDLYNRDSRIELNGVLLGHPLEANIWQLSQEKQVEYLKSIALAGCNQGKPMPKKFVDWIYWKLGEKIADDYMLPYNRKMFGNNLNMLGTYWLEKLPNVSFEETLLSCINRKPYGRQPGHAQFYYPRQFGYGEVWLRMATSIEGNIVYNSKVTMMDVDKRICYTDNGQKYAADYIITTIPWDCVNIVGLADSESYIINYISKLKHTGVEVAYFSENQEADAQWIYVPDESKSYHRILSRKTFCSGSRGYWTETNLDRVADGESQVAFRNQYAYPLNTIDKPEIMSKLLTMMADKSIIGLGRWGEHEHYNSDVVVEKAICLADKLI